MIADLQVAAYSDRLVPSQKPQPCVIQL